MSRRRNPVHRSSRAWAIRLTLAAIALVLGYFCLAYSIAQVVANGNATLAHRLAPYDGRLTALMAASLSGPNATASDRARSDRLAKRALRQDATAVVALSTLGSNADARGSQSLARHYFKRAQTLSRRDVRTQLWMIEYAVGRGDVPAALRQYDMTLRVFPDLTELLFPILASANSNPAIRPELVKTLAGRPPWGESFILSAAKLKTDPKGIASLFLALRHSDLNVPAAANANTVNALWTAGDRDAAWSYYAKVHTGADRRRSRDPNFNGTMDAASPFDWITLGNGGLSTTIQDGAFGFAAPASIGGPMLQQFQLLPPARYRLVGHSTGIDQMPSARPYWVLNCQDGRELGRLEIPNSDSAGGKFVGLFTVPRDCPVQMLVLVARTSDAISGLSGQLDNVELAPAD